MKIVDSSDIDENDFPKEYHEIIRKLQRAVSDEEIQNTMDVEDEIVAELEDKERRIEELLDSINQKDSLISEKDNVISEKDNVINEKDNVINEKDKLIEELKRKLDEK